ncbi:hypothetical protein ABZZ36_28645 [Actinacidiphila glaucinigra]|uniref:hypothetical protein n=1 Tax=Actinacidiphila glaucinigra TaxID=235986 RepID=UPI0033B7B46F
MPQDIASPPADDSTIQQEYAHRIEDDLARNTAARSEAHDAIQRWQGHLAKLEHEANWLVNLRSTLTGQPASPATGAGATQSEVGSAEANAQPQGVPAPRAARGKAGGRGGRGKTAAGAARGKAAGAAKGPTLGAVIHERLLQHKQPRTAAEVTSDLAEALPDRSVGTPVVRGTLEQLVAKGRISRSRQGRTVYYTADTSPSGSAATGDAEVAAANE